MTLKEKTLTSAYVVCAKYLPQKLITGILCAFILFFIPFSGIAHQYDLGNLEIIHPWVRETPQGAKVSGGYIHIVNRGNTPDRLVSVSMNGVKKAEIHSMEIVNDIMKMEEMPNGIEIPGNSEVMLKPGGSHIMLTGLEQPFQMGDKISATLTFEKAGAINVTFNVEKATAKTPHSQ